MALLVWSLPVFNPLNLRPTSALRGDTPLQKLTDISELGFRAIRIVEIIALLQNGSMLWDTAKRRTSGCLTGKPISFSLVVDQIELRVAMPGDPNSPGGNIACAA